MIRTFELIFICQGIILILASCKYNAAESDLKLPQKAPEVEELPVPEKNIDKRMAQLKKLHQIRTGKYIIGPGDKFNFSVYGEEDLRTFGLLCKPDGTITVKLVGEVKASGKTVSDVSKEIENRMTRYIKSPKISLEAYDIKSGRFTIVGKINQPGVYQVQDKTNLSDSIAIAGGLSTGWFQNNTVELADLENSFILRDNEILPVDFVKAIKEGNALNNIPLTDGDYIFINSSMNREIFVLGQVNKPGYIGFQENMTLVQALSYAGDIIEETSSSVAVIVRGSVVNPKIFNVNVHDILRGETRDFPLQANDIVYMPKGDISKWNQIVGKIMPTLQLIQTSLDIKENTLPIKGELLPGRHPSKEWLIYDRDSPYSGSQ